jgi:Flp pilus assembly protein CpaB
MSPDDAQKLGLASNFGTVQFALRNGADQAQAERRPAFMQELQGNFSAPAPRAPAANRTVAAHKSNDYEVEVFEGTKKSVQKF